MHSLFTFCCFFQIFLVFCYVLRIFAADYILLLMQTNSHLSRLIQDQAMKYGDREELIYKDFGSSEWKSMTWNQFSATVKQVSNAMLNLGIKVQENVGTDMLLVVETEKCVFDNRRNHIINVLNVFELS